VFRFTCLICSFPFDFLESAASKAPPILKSQPNDWLNPTNAVPYSLGFFLTIGYFFLYLLDLHFNCNCTS
jgi:hypothetical protein